jgi:AcrR family transcriptional regulator
VARAVPLTAKGARQSEAIIEAAIVCLGRDGYSGSSLQRIADEAGVGKRAVIYYFANRETLIDQVVQRIASRLLGQVAGAIAGLEEPADIVRVGFARVWSHLTSDRALLAAYYGLVAEAVTNDDLKDLTRHLTDGYRDLIGREMAEIESRGHELQIDPPVLIEMIIAGIQGLTLSWLERGTTPALEQAIAAFQVWLSALAPLPGPGARSAQAPSA